MTEARRRAQRITCCNALKTINVSSAGITYRSARWQRREAKPNVTVYYKECTPHYSTLAKLSTALSQDL